MYRNRGISQYWKKNKLFIFLLKKNISCGIYIIERENMKYKKYLEDRVYWAIDENEKRIQYPLLEASLSRIWKHVSTPDGTFGVVSAFDHKNKTLEENLERHEELRRKLKFLRLGFFEQFAEYTYDDSGETHKEYSFFIPYITFEGIIDIGRKYQQESVIFKDATRFGLFDCQTKEQSMSFAKKDKNGQIYTTDSKVLKDAYSALIKANDKHRIRIAYIAENHPATYANHICSQKLGRKTLYDWVIIENTL